MSDYTEQQFGNSNIIENKATVLAQNTQKKITGLATGNWESATLESYPDADSPVIAGVTGGVGKGGNLSGVSTEDRDPNFDAYEVAHPGDPYRNTQSGIAKYERQRQRLEEEIKKDPTLVQKLSIKDPSKISDDDIARAGTREQLLGLYNLIPGDKQAWEPGPLDYYDKNRGIELGSKENPLNIEVERRAKGEYDYFGRPLAEIRNKDTDVRTVDALGYDGTEDSRYDAIKAANRLREEGSLTPELEKYLTKNTPRYQSSGIDSNVDLSGGTEYIRPVEQGITDRLAAAPGAFAGSVVGGAVGVADFLTGGRVIGRDNVEAVERTVSKNLGYDKALYKYEDAKRQELMKDAFKDVQVLSPESYKNIDWEKAGELFKEGITDPILIAQSLGVLVGGGGIGGAGIKAGVKLLSKGDEVISAANKAKEVVAANTALSAADKAAEIAKIEAGVTLGNKIGNLAVKGSGAAGYGATITSEDIAEYAKNNNGELPGVGQMLGMFTANTLAVALPEIASTKFVLGINAAEDVAKKATIGKAVGAALGHVAMSGLVELPQETIQAAVQTVNQRLGTEKYKDKTVGEIVNGATADILGQGVLGAGSGVAMGAMKPAADITKGIGNASVDVANELLEKAGITDTPEVEAKKEVYNLKEYENIAPEDRAAKTKDVIQYATLMIVDPREAKDNGYERGRVRLADVVDKVAKINEISDENKQYIYKDVMDGIKSTLVAYAKTDSNAAKMEVFKEMLKANKNPEAVKAINSEIDNVVTEELDSVSAKLSDALGKHVDLSTVKISDEEITKINGVISQLRMMGSEELKNKALAIEDVIKGLGRKKSWEDVREDIKKAGFVFFGKSYKSLEKHDDDISREIALGTGTEETEKLVNFVNQRKADDRVRFEEERNGKIVDRSLQPLRAFAEINNKDNEDIMKTIDGLLVKAKDGTENKRLLEESKVALQGIMNKYDAMIAANTVDEFKGLYTGKIEPKVVEKPEIDVKQAQKEFVDKIINKSESADQALVVFNNMKNVHKLDQETRSRLEDQIRNAEKFSKVEPETKPEKEIEVAKEEIPKTETKKPETVKKPEPKVVDKELEVISKPVAEFKETMSDLEYYTQAENWSKEANQRAKAELKKTNERLRAIYKELDGITSSKEQVQSKLDKVKEDIRLISRRITSTNNKLDRMETTSWKLVAEVMDGLKNLVNDMYKVLYRLLKLKEIKQFKADKLLSELKAMNEDKKSLIEEMKQLKELKSEQVDKVIMEANELKEIKQRLVDAEKEMFSTTYGEDSAKLFKKVDSDKVTLTNKFSEDIKTIEEVNKLVGQGSKKREVIKNVTEKLAEDIKELMPKSILKRLDKDSEVLTKAIETFMDYRYGETKKIPIPKQEKGSALEFLNSWLENSELNNRLHVALDVAGLVVMDDMMSVRTLNSSMLEDMIDGAFGVKKDDPAFKWIKKDIQSGKYVPMSSFTKSAGAKVVSELGLKFDDKQVSMQDKQDVQFALGQLVLERAKLQVSQEIKAGTIGISASSITLETKDGVVIGAKVTEGYEEGRSTENIKRIVDLSGIKNKKGLREVSSVLEYAGEKTDGELQFEPTVIDENKSVRNSNVKMSKDAVKYINKNNAISWKFSDEFKELYVMAKDKAKKDKTSINEVMYGLLLDDISNDDLKKMTVDDVESELAKREAEKLEIDRMLMGYELAGSDKFYLNWDQTISGRYMIANKMINPQNSKIVRFLVQTDDMKSSLTRGAEGYDGKDISVIKGAIAQAFDYGIDKYSDANVFAKMAKELVSINENGTEIKYPDTEKGKQLKEAVKAYRGLDIVKAIEVLKDMGIETNERMHTLQALKVLSGLEQQQKVINHGLVVEIDAITNGMILTLLEIGSEWAMDMLAKGGIYWGANKDKYENHGEFKQAGGVDIYQTPVELLTGMIDDGSKVGNMITEVLGDDLGKWRNALKPLVMVYIYGAGMKSIVSKAGTEFGELLMRNFIKNNDVNGMAELLKEAGISTDRLEFVNKAKLLRGESKAVTGRLTESNMGDLRLTPYQMYQLNKKISDTVGSALEESFERSFKEISEYRKVLKTAEILNYVVFKQELNRLVKDRESITIDELNKVLVQMQKDGTYYGAMNSSGSVQDYVKLGTEGSKEISVTGFYNKSASGKTTEITVNSALKWFKSNIGAVGVTAVHDKDGRVMAESDNDGTLNIYDAKVLPASYKRANKNSVEMNKAVLDVSRNHSILAEAVEKVDRLLEKIDLKGIDKELTEELVEDMNRVYGENNWISGTEFAEKLKEIRDNRTKNVSREMDVNHVYALDSLEGVKAGEGEVRTIELTDDEIDNVGKKLDEVTGKVGKNVQDKVLDKQVESELERQGMSKEDKSIIDDELKKAGTDLLAVIRQLVKGCKE